MDRQNIRKVYVVFKTHLDIGFTDMGQTVLDRYVNDYIPHSIDLARQMNNGENKKFIWTVGSYLIDYFFEHGSKEYCEKLENAIKNGDICWHGLACTTHTELMDEDLLDFDLSLSDVLDARFGRETIASKMTDVPGHTKAILRQMCRHGKKYLHIGVNASSMVPDVPSAFVWKDGENELIVQYSFDYGTPCYVEGMDSVLEFAHTGDNLGPQSEEAVMAEIERIQALYPNAAVAAATMDDYARCLWDIKDNLPVITEEIGDTWIHGIASDPLKVMRYKALLNLKDEWKSRGVNIKDEVFKPFLMNLMLVAEHTWGLDFKKYLADFKNWAKDDFLKAREADATTLDFLTNRNAHMLGVLNEDFKKYRGGVFTGSYAFYEKSHAEQMAYIYKAVDSLPQAYQTSAKQCLEQLESKRRRHFEAMDFDKERQLYPYEIVEIGGWKVSFGGNGELVTLKNGGKDWTDQKCFGRLVYTTYNARDCVNNYYSYNRAFERNQCWSEGDFSKPGLENVEDLEHRDYTFAAKKIVLSGNTVTAALLGNPTAVCKYSCPAEAVITYTFEDKVKISLSWQDKDAGKIPEALWFEMNMNTENPYCWTMKKMGTTVHPLFVARGGNRRQHCAEELNYSGADGSVSIKSFHAPLVSVGGNWLYGDYRQQPDMNNGFAWCLFNNKWGTNFKMWCEDDCCFEFEVDIDDYSSFL